MPLTRLCPEYIGKLSKLRHVKVLENGLDTRPYGKKTTVCYLASLLIKVLLVLLTWCQGSYVRCIISNLFLVQHCFKNFHVQQTSYYMKLLIALDRTSLDCYPYFKEEICKTCFYKLFFLCLLIVL